MLFLVWVMLNSMKFCCSWDWILVARSSQAEQGQCIWPPSHKQHPTATPPGCRRSAHPEGLMSQLPPMKNSSDDRELGKRYQYSATVKLQVILTCLTCLKVVVYQLKVHLHKIAGVCGSSTGCDHCRPNNQNWSQPDCQGGCLVADWLSCMRGCWTGPSHVPCGTRMPQVTPGYKSRVQCPRTKCTCLHRRQAEKMQATWGGVGDSEHTNDGASLHRTGMRATCPSCGACGPHMPRTSSTGAVAGQELRYKSYSFIICFFFY